MAQASAFTAGDNVLFDGAQATVLRVYLNGRCKIEFWVDRSPLKPALWRETVPCSALAAR